MVCVDLSVWQHMQGRGSACASDQLKALHLHETLSVMSARPECLVTTHLVILAVLCTTPV